jgi:hypothetical protein
MKPGTGCLVATIYDKLWDRGLGAGERQTIAYGWGHLHSYLEFALEQKRKPTEPLLCQTLGCHRGLWEGDVKKKAEVGVVRGHEPGNAGL